MKKFLKSNGFVKVPKRGKHINSIYCCPANGIFVTIFQNGQWNVGKAGGEDLESLYSWRQKIEEYIESKASGV